YRLIKKENMEPAVQYQSWANSMTVGGMIDVFHTNCSKALNNVAQIKTKPFIEKQNSWFDEEIKRAIISRDGCYKKALSGLGIIWWRIYREKRNEVVTLLRSKKQIYYENL
ncbi:hypothetical protein HHI36_016743, partial [Cryptolaemus montrouzieri]